MTETTKHKAMLYEPMEGQKVRCELCGHQCVVGPDRYGACRVRKNVGGELVTLNYDAVVAIHVDPIEKKPLFHFLPGSRSLSIAAAGCNFRCEFCQNWQISQRSAEAGELGGEAIAPADIVAAAERQGCKSISYTYTEPTVFFELAYDTGKLAHERGIRNVFVSNGYMTPKAVGVIAPHLDAINADLKAFREETYRTVMKARLEPVLDCLRELVKAGVWLEVTTLVVPGMNDSDAELGDIAKFIAGDLGPDVPWHISRFHAEYKMDRGTTTPVAVLHRAAERGRQAGLKYVYCGNVPGDDGESTFCPSCRERLIHRVGFSIVSNRLADGCCPSCRTEIAGVWS